MLRDNGVRAGGLGGKEVKKDEKASRKSGDGGGREKCQL